MVVSNFFYSHSLKNHELPERSYACSRYNNIESMVEVNDGCFFTSLFNKLFRSDCIKNNRIRMSTGYCEDYEFLKDCFKNECSAIYYNKPLYTYVLSNNTRSFQKGDEIARQDLRIYGDI